MVSDTDASVLRSLAHLLAFSSCAWPGPHRPAPDAPPWSKAGRSARARQASACMSQVTPSKRRGITIVGGPRSRAVDTSCLYERFLCQQIHRGAQATDGEKAQCREFESVHGRVSAR